jgi:adenosine deaminase
MYLPNIDLHLHLDGSVKKETLCELYENKFNQDLPGNALISIKDGEPTLTEYLEYFKYPILLMKDDFQAIKRVASEMIEQLFDHNVGYAEVRYAPQLLTDKHTIETYVKIMKAVQDGFKLGMKKYPQVEVKTIICLMRGLPYEINKNTFEAVKVLGDKNIVAFDLAGDEYNYSGKELKDLFQEIKKENYFLTIHAGEARGPESIQLALDFGADRIGHGLSLYLSNSLLEEVAKKQICIETCPISNFQTGASKRFGYEIKRFLENGVPVCFNTDNMTVSNTSLLKEVHYLKENYGFSDKDILNMRLFASKYSFKKNS